VRIAVFGLGYVGTVTAAALASRGHDVCGMDVDPLKVELIRTARSPVVEPSLDALVAQGVTRGALTATSDVAVALDRADVSLLCVGTPSSARGDVDLGHVRRALESIHVAMKAAAPPPSGFHVVVIRSTVPPGTSESLLVPAFADDELPAGWAVGIAMCPEFLREGSGVMDFFDPPFVVVGAVDPRVRDTLTTLFAFLGREIRHLDLRGAEALKYACNAFHATKISFTNEIARVLRTLEVDSRQVMDVFCEDHVLNVSPAYLRPGFAYGGSCLPKDLRALVHLARAHGLDVPLLAGTIRTNEIVLRDVVDHIVAGPSRQVAMLGLSFKPGTDDLRESPQVELAERLMGKGFDLRLYDPIVKPECLMGANLRHIDTHLPHLRRLLAPTPREALADSDTAIVATSDALVVTELCQAQPSRILDLHGGLGTEVEQLPGYEGIGWVA
jgi:GDP-mannose 6-dehydrogenase